MMRRNILAVGAAILLSVGGLSVGWYMGSSASESDQQWTRQKVYELFGDYGLQQYDKIVRYDISGEGLLREGDLAPDFELRSVDGQIQRISDYHRDRPLVLAFGSYT